ncbi:hypothetical protein CLIB1423_05S06458 [[Candida] railenensis]|uniref:GATA-type domain-containing protein n=1 Tax=[Candida] railenensis TaxID=45579 RepID=A0A9P0QMS7_9ASCO|nr:hypothetical protein CLIB1423_05S06458 [[Candida] railenensis]
MLPSFSELTKELDEGSVVHQGYGYLRSPSMASFNHNRYSCGNLKTHENYDYCSSQPRVYEFPAMENHQLELLKESCGPDLKSQSSVSPSLSPYLANSVGDASAAREMCEFALREWKAITSKFGIEEENYLKMIKKHESSTTSAEDVKSFICGLSMDCLKDNFDRISDMMKTLQDLKLKWSKRSTILSKVDVNHKGHRRTHSSPANIQNNESGTSHKAKIHKIRKHKTSSSISFEQKHFGEDVYILDVDINPERVIASAEAVEGIQDPSISSSGGLNPELSITPKPLECNHCSCTSSPEWRRGPDGKRTLCNACGLFYSKLFKKFGKNTAVEIMYERKESGAKNDRSIS